MKRPFKKQKAVDPMIEMFGISVPRGISAQAMQSVANLLATAGKRNVQIFDRSKPAGFDRPAGLFFYTQSWDDDPRLYTQRDYYITEDLKLVVPIERGMPGWLVQMDGNIFWISPERALSLFGDDRHMGDVILFCDNMIQAYSGHHFQIKKCKDPQGLQMMRLKFMHGEQFDPWPEGYGPAELRASIVYKEIDNAQ